MSVRLGILSSVLVSGSVIAAPAPRPRESTTTQASKAIAYAKQLDVSRLDPTLPKRPLDQWMRESGAPAKGTRWDVSDGCSQQYTAETKADALLCVQFTIVHGNAGIRGMIQVGTMRDGVTGEPRSWELWFAARGWKNLERTKGLSELPRLIAKLQQY